MIPVERRRRIRENIDAQGAATIAELSDAFDVSEMTVRRDLKQLAEDGHVRRTHGGAVRVERTPSPEPRYTAKQQLHAPQKAAIARYAARELVEPGDVILLEGGTTVTEMAPHLTGPDLTAVTNGLYTLNALRASDRVQVICCGGILRRGSFTFVGPVAEQFFREFHANKAFLSATGWTADKGFTDPNMLEVQIKRAMQQAAEEVIVLLDASKFGVRSLSTSLETAKADRLVTDGGIPEAAVQALRDQGVNVHAVPLTPADGQAK